jgi:WD40 repeat protein
VISRDATARLWDVASGKLVAALAGHESEVRCARFGPDGRFIVTCSADFTARIWDAKSLKTLFVLQPKQLVDDAAFTPDGARLVTVGSSQAHVWDTKDAKLLATLEAPRTGSLKRVVLSPDGGRALIVGYSNRANVWDLASGTVAYFIEQKTEVRVARFSPDGKYLVTGSQDNTGTIWDAATGARLVTLKGHSESVLDAAFSPDSTRVATAGYDGTIRTWRAPPYTK